MRYDFDAIVTREKTSSIKWNPNFYKAEFHQREGLLPLWVADMDFKVSAGIQARLEKLVAGGIFGYAKPDSEYYDAVTSWYERRHNFLFTPEEVVFTPGIVPALNHLITTCTQEGDAILIQTPVYYPFARSIRNNKRRLVTSALTHLPDGHYVADYADMEQKIQKNQVKVFILCSPHNPVGKVWAQDDLEKMMHLCLRYNVLVIADEIHCDLVFFGHKHTPAASLSQEIAHNTITCNAVSKTFNLAGVQASNIIIKNPELRAAYKQTLEKLCVELPNIFALEAVKGAYLESDDWYEQMLDYIGGTISFASEYIAAHIPHCSMRRHEGTYLGWIDMRGLGLGAKGLEELLEAKAKVALDHGHWFGPEGEGFARINLACPRSIVQEALGRIQRSLQ